MVRKPSILKQATDTKLDGAYADLQAIPNDPEFGGGVKQQQMIDAVQSTGGMPPAALTQPAFKPQDLFALPTERAAESGLADSNPMQEVGLNPGSDTQILIDIIKEESPTARLRF